MEVLVVPLKNVVESRRKWMGILDAIARRRVKDHPRRAVGARVAALDVFVVPEGPAEAQEHLGGENIPSFLPSLHAVTSIPNPIVFSNALPSE